MCRSFKCRLVGQYYDMSNYRFQLTLQSLPSNVTAYQVLVIYGMNKVYCKYTCLSPKVVFYEIDFPFQKLHRK